MAEVNRRHTQIGVIIILALLILTLLAMPALAGDGDGTGGGRDNPLNLVSAIPVDGQRDVALSAEIKLTFNKNVINMSVKDNNRKCFALYSAAGAAIPIEVKMADDQMEPEKKRDVILSPLQDLQPGTTYIVKVAPELQAKNGVTLGKQITISFVTAGTGKPSGDKKNNPAPKGTAIVTGASSSGGLLAPVNNNQANGNQTSGTSDSSANSTDITTPTTADNGDKSAGNKKKIQVNSQASETVGQGASKGMWPVIGLALVAAIVYAGYKQFRK